MTEAAIVVMSRDLAENTPAEPGSVCISITDRHRSAARLDGFSRVLRLVFDDIECEGGDYLPLSARQARAILEFVQENRGNGIRVHCEFGYSRSVAVGVFLSAWLKRPLVADLTRPNSWVIRRLCEQGLRRGLRDRDWRLVGVSLVGPMHFARENPATIAAPSP